MKGAAGPAQEGFLVNIKELNLFGISFKNLAVASHDFTDFERYGFDGLLGFDIIKQLHLELNGPAGELRVL